MIGTYVHVSVCDIACQWTTYETEALSMCVIFAPGYFAIDPSTGVLSLISLVNYESDKQLYFNVTATDGGTPSLSDTASVTVVVIDANDNSPKFPTTPYSEAVSIDEGNYPVDGRQLLTTVSLLYQ